MASPRSKILKALGEHLDSVFGPEGTGDFRRAKYGRWNPAASDRPNLTVVDDGQRRDDEEVQEGYGKRRLRAQLILDLEGDVSSPEDLEALTDLVEQISGECCAWRMDGAAGEGEGIEAVEYLDDDPYTAEIEGGAAREVWVINIEIVYFIEISG